MKKQNKFDKQFKKRARQLNWTELQLKDFYVSYYNQYHEVVIGLLNNNNISTQIKYQIIKITLNHYNKLLDENPKYNSDIIISNLSKRILKKIRENAVNHLKKKTKWEMKK